jgi:pilus assembly protein CpaF
VNPLELFEDPAITDILIDGDKRILIEAAGQLAITENKFDSDQSAMSFAKSLFEKNNIRFDLAQPFAETNLNSQYGQLRVHALQSGECSELTHMSIRRHPANHLSLKELQENQFITVEQAAQLKHIIQSKKNFVVIGPTGTGKTTLLRAMLSEVINERIITIEDSGELSLGGLSVSLVSRAKNQDGFGQIKLSELVRQSLRMRPDRIVIGEARGAELKVLLNALNTGHSGSGFTLHANKTEDLYSRLLILLAMGGIKRALGKQLIKSSIDYCIEVARLEGIRKVVSITALGELHG